MGYMNYEERFEVAKRLYELSNAEQKTALECIFPELCESEDEKIRKLLIEAVTQVLQDQYCSNRGVSKEKVVAWLEKQGNKESKKMPIWKHWKDGICGNGEGKLIYLIKNGDDYSLSSSLGFECDYIELSELDNLMLEKQGTSYTKRDVDDAFVEGMALAKNELEKQGSEENKGNLGGISSNSAWSEEDKKMIEAAINLAHEYGRHGLWVWLKSLKERYTWKPSDEQMEALDFAADCIVPAEFCFKRKELKGLLEQLKKLKGE